MRGLSYFNESFSDYGKKVYNYTTSYYLQATLLRPSGFGRTRKLQAMKTLSLTITGLVQGVFFRTHTEEMAKRLNIKGWVRNEPDGSVQVIAQGEEKTLNNFINWCKKGPPSARVEKVKVEEIQNNNQYSDFVIKY